MMLMKLMNYIIKPLKKEVGNIKFKVDECLPPAFYVKRNFDSRWQGDIYPSSEFKQDALPTKDIPYWFLVNRTCHLVDEENRKPIPFLCFVAVYPLKEFIEVGKESKSIKNQIDNIIKKSEKNLFFPECEEYGIQTPLVADLTLVYSIALENCPKASYKILQLSSPFREYAIQKFARCYYTVSFDNKKIWSKDYIKKLEDQIKEEFNSL